MAEYGMLYKRGRKMNGNGMLGRKKVRYISSTKSLEKTSKVLYFCLLVLVWVYFFYLLLGFCYKLTFKIISTNLIFDWAKFCVIVVTFFLWFLTLLSFFCVEITAKQLQCVVSFVWGMLALANDKTQNVHDSKGILEGI